MKYGYESEWLIAGILAYIAQNIYPDNTGHTENSVTVKNGGKYG